MALEQPRSSARAKLSISRYSAIFLVLLLVVVALVYASVHAIVEQQQQKLLKSRADQLNQTMQAYTGTVTGALNTIALASGLPFPRSIAVMRTLGLGQTQNPDEQSAGLVALVHKAGSEWMVSQSFSMSTKPPAVSTGERLTGQRLALIESVAGTPKSIVFSSAGKREFGMAVGSPMADTGSAVYFEFPTDGVLNLPGFDGLNVAIYRAPTHSDGDLVATTASSVPLKGKVVTPPSFKVGDEQWSIQVGAKRPLIGSVAWNLPWILVVISFWAGIIVIALIEIVVRRRNYAMALVDERTAALQDSLDQLNRAQDQLVSSQRMAALGEMAASVGHELRNPLAVLTNSMYLVRHAVEGNANDRLRRNLDTADREIAAATLIVSDLLEFSRPRQPAPDNIIVNDLIKETLSAAPPRDGITVDVKADDVPPIVADRAQLRQVLLNLIINSYDAMPEGGNVNIEATSTNGTMHIAVSDTGVGADPEQLARVFEPFWTSKTKGIGLGLAVSKRIMESHNGTIELMARPDHGCTATITLPLHAVNTGAPS